MFSTLFLCQKTKLNKLNNTLEALRLGSFLRRIGFKSSEIQLFPKKSAEF